MAKSSFGLKQPISQSGKSALAGDILSGGKTNNYKPEADADGDDDSGDGDATKLPGKFASMHIKAHENGLSCETCHEGTPKKGESYGSTSRMEHVFNNPDEAIKHITKHIRAAYKK